MIHLQAKVRIKGAEEEIVIRVSEPDDERAFAMLHEQIRESEWVSLSIEGRAGAARNVALSRP